jgi:hypothetical protein
MLQVQACASHHMGYLHPRDGAVGVEELGHGSAELWLRCAPAWHGRMATTIDTHRMLQVQACATHQMGWGMAQQVASHMGYLHPRDGAVDGSHHRHPQDAGGACLCHSPDGLGDGSAGSIPHGLTTP